MDTSSLIDVLRSAVPGVSVDAAPSTDMPAIVVDRTRVRETLRVLRDDPALQFALLVDVTAVDYLPAAPRFEIVYHLACLGAAYATGAPAPASRLRLKSRVPGDDPWIDSCTSIFPAAGWPEREIFDLFGIHFEGHPDLRRILMPEDWEGYPLRKDYPVQIKEPVKTYEALQVTQEEFVANLKAAREHGQRE